MQVGEEVDASGVAHAEALLARAHGERLEDVALAGAALAGDDEVVLPADEVEARELEDEGLVELGLEGPVERLEGLLLLQAARVDASRDALLELVRGLDPQDVLEERRRSGPLARRPRERLVELRERAR